MGKTNTIEFVLNGKLNGVQITPQTIGLSQFNEFNRQIEEFIGGIQKPKLDQVHVEIAEGSYRARIMIPATILTALQPDLKLMAKQQDVLGEIDPKRAEIVEKWQDRARRIHDLIYEVRSEEKAFTRVRISHDTDFRVGDVAPWVAIEKYLFGQVVDMGGAQKANLHVKLDQDGKIVIVGATQNYLRAQLENRLYHKALLHVRAEQHHRTGEMRNIHLISFMDYHPTYDEDALDRFAEEGAKAWADVPDAVMWIREKRGA